MKVKKSKASSSCFHMHFAGMICYRALMFFVPGVATLESVRLLFDMLDFACWQNIDKPWSRLAAQLTEIYQG